jgi:hypothetical protein
MLIRFLVVGGLWCGYLAANLFTIHKCLYG